MAQGMNRRAALGGAAGAALAIGVARAQAKPLVIEWNMHMFSSNMAKFPYSPKATYKPDPAKNPADPLVVYQKRMTDEGIDKALFVQPEPYGDDHRLVLDCLHRTSPDKFKGTSLFYPKDSQAPGKLAALVKSEPRIVSTRFHAHRGKETYLNTFADSGVRALWKRAVDLGLVIELHIGPNYARSAGQAIAAFPGCKVLIDHLAEQAMGTPAEFADVLDLAQYPNVYMKLSGLNHFAKDAPLYENERPFTRRVIAEFGPERVVWGSGTPKIVDAHMKGYAPSDIAAVKGGNLKRLLKW
ncbi:MAG TPA: amidohydrolase family protein [Devosia sp.]|nr:amidohydrolase family protein [Devosia sp.]